MAKRAKKTSSAKKSRSKTSSAKGKRDAPLPGPQFMEQMMRGMFGERQDRDHDAQEFAYEAMEAMADGDWDRAHQQAMKAITLDSNCVDALLVMSQLGSENDEELIENIRRTVDRGQQALGKKFFKENIGWFWGLIETRPYMRARAQLASLLKDSGKIDEAVEHFEEMLRLNPGDNQGLRYSLLGCYLEQGNASGAERLFAEYPDEGSAVFEWARVLATFIAGDETGAAKRLADARTTNKHVESFLTGRKKTPTDGPGYYSPGDPSEAIICMHEIGTAWSMHPRAIDWLKRQKVK